MTLDGATVNVCDGVGPWLPARPGAPRCPGCQLIEQRTMEHLR